MSAIRVSKFCDCLALLGTNVKSVYNNILTNYDSFVVWLDHDNYHVIRKEYKIIKKLQLLGYVKHLITDKDPKEYSDEKIKEYLK